MTHSIRPADAKGMKRKPEMLKLLEKKAGRNSVMACFGLLAVLVVACFIISFNLIADRDHVAAEERSADAAKQVSAQFRQMIDDGILQLRIAADSDADRPREEMDLSILTDQTNFSGAALTDGDLNIIAESGNLPDNITEEWSCAYSENGTDAWILIHNGGLVQLRVPVENDASLAAWIDADKLESMMRSVLAEQFGYVVYNAKTGAYLLNKSHFKENSYYDSIMERIDGGEAEELLKQTGSSEAYFSDDAEYGNTGYYIAQASTGIDFISIALIIPEELVDYDVRNPYKTQLIEFLTLTVLLLAIIGSAYFCSRIIANRRKTIAKAVDMKRDLLNTAARCGNMVVFVYNRKNESLESCYGDKCEGIMFNKDKETVKLRALTKELGLSDEDVEKLLSKINRLQAGEEAEISFRIAETGEEHRENINLNCPAGNPDLINGIVYQSTDNSDASDSASEEQNFFRMMQSKSISIWTVNVSRGTWRAAYCLDRDSLKRMGVLNQTWRSYEEDMKGFIRRYIHPDDLDSYTEKVSEKGIAALYRSGKDEFVHEYRAMNPEKNDYEWHRQMVRIYKNSDSNDVFANLYVQNINAEKKAEIERKEHGRILNRTLTALGGIYYGLFYVELDNNLCYTAKAPGGEMVTKMCVPYKETFDHYIEQTVHPDDRSELLTKLDTYSLRKSMTDTNHCLRLKYRKQAGDDYIPVSITVQAARLENGTVRDVVIAMQNTGREVS